MNSDIAQTLSPNSPTPAPSPPQLSSTYGFAACNVAGNATLFASSSDGSKIYIYDVNTWKLINTIILSNLGSISPLLDSGNMAAVYWNYNNQDNIRVYYTTTSGFQELCLTGLDYTQWSAGQTFSNPQTSAVAAVVISSASPQINVYSVTSGAVLTQWDSASGWASFQIANGSSDQTYSGVAATRWNTGNTNIRVYVQVNSGGSGYIQEYCYGPAWTEGNSLTTNSYESNLACRHVFSGEDADLNIFVAYVCNSLTSPELGYAQYAQGSWVCSTQVACDEDSNVTAFVNSEADSVTILYSNNQSACTLPVSGT